MKKIPICLLAFLPLSFSLFSCADTYYSVNPTPHTEHIVKQPTCTEEGVGYIEDTTDSKDYEEVAIPALGHKPSRINIEATCLTDGYDLVYCSRCGEELGLENVVEALGHDFVTHVISPTCLHPGHVESYCSRCGMDKYPAYELEQLDHEYVVDEVHPATCSEDGYEILKCLSCGHRTKGAILPKLGHSFITIEELEATCTEGGHSEYQLCTRCGEKEHYQVYMALGHDWVHTDKQEPNCETDGHSAYDTCSRCGFSQGYAHYEPYGHKYVHTIKEATCLEDGYTMHTCIYCGNTYYDTEVKAFGHAYVQYEGKEPDCGHSGFKPYKMCLNCGDNNYEVLPPTGEDHVYFDEVITPQTHSYGYTLHTCKECGVSYQDEFVAPLSPYHFYNSTTARDLGKHGSRLLTSHRDDDFYYFAIYQGRAEDIVVHDFAEFTWTEAVQRLHSYPKQFTYAKKMDVLERHSDQVNQWSSTIPSTLVSYSPIKTSNSVIRLGDKNVLGQHADGLFSTSGFSTTLLELTDPDLNNFTNDINNLELWHDIEAASDVFGENLTYTYVATASFDLYIGATYDIKNDVFTYYPFTSVVDLKSELYGSSGALRRDIEKVDIESSVSALLKKPDSYATNHPLINTSWSFHINGTETVKVGGSFSMKCTFANNLASNALNAGYDAIKFDITYSYWTSSFLWEGHYVICEVSDLEINFSLGRERHDGNNAVNVNFVTYSTAFDSFASSDGFIVRVLSYTDSGGANIFRNFCLYDVTIKTTIYHQGANSEGAYPNL